ncbi:Peptidase family M48 [Rheinheimera pacifica]|uniref:Peptidase family M48 n=1 Tax=Rheinheimera pacifica TaxID=173990 RepID=A0A1H6LHJ1_9GAMM|nr:M48 family metallopeptidase [Rheinheimera pacifica]SEH85693.1 Peptidase family M48 [Rheinheimera pacifica]
MAYKGRLPTDNHNVSHQQPAKELLLLGSALLLATVLIYLLLGLLIDRVVSSLDPELEYKWFGHFAIAPNQPGAQQQALQQLTNQLQQCSTMTYPVQLHFVEQNISNASVLPGGIMLVYQGLLKQVNSENALSFVLAHELAHLEHRDHLRGLGRALVLASLVYGVTGSSNASQWFMPATELGLAQHSQQRELAADAKALTILHCHYGHTGGAEDFFKAMQQQSSSALPDWFDSHPALSKRLAQLALLQQQQGYPVKDATPLPDMLQP